MNPIAGDAPFAIGYVHKGSENPLRSLGDSMAFDSRDWANNYRDAWLYGIVHGWEDESLAEMGPRFGWDEKTVVRLKRLHGRFKKLSEISDDLQAMAEAILESSK